MTFRYRQGSISAPGFLSNSFEEKIRLLPDSRTQVLSLEVNLSPSNLFDSVLGGSDFFVNVAAIYSNDIIDSLLDYTNPKVFWMDGKVVADTGSGAFLDFQSSMKMTTFNDDFVGSDFIQIQAQVPSGSYSFPLFFYKLVYDEEKN